MAQRFGRRQATIKNLWPVIKISSGCATRDSAVQTVVTLNKPRRRSILIVQDGFGHAAGLTAAFN
jgi:hypothetical protein